jgi:hypothetical protein
MFNANLLQKRKKDTKIQLMAIYKKLSAMKKHHKLFRNVSF